MLLIVVRDVMLLALAGLILRDMWHPELDIVRTGGLDDPGGGVFDRARDYFARSGHNGSEMASPDEDMSIGAIPASNPN